MPKTQDTKNIILEHAKTLFSEKGYYDTQISDIINSAKIGRGTVYQYFANKETIFMTLLESFYDEWQKSVEINLSADEMKNITPVSYFGHRIRQTLIFLANDQERTHLILRTGIGLGGDFESFISRFEKKITLMVSNDLKLGIKNGFLKPDLDVEFASNLIAGGILRIAYFYFVNKHRQCNAKNIDTITDKILNMYVPGIFLEKSY